MIKPAARGLYRSQGGFIKTAGDIFSLYIGSRLYVVINECKLIREALVANADALSNRPPMLHFEGSTSGLLFSNGSLWKEQRTTSISILRSFGVGKSSLANKISEEISEYLKALAQLGGRPEDVSMLTRTSVSNIICSIIVCKRFDYHDPFLIAFLESFEKQVRAAENLSPVIVWPWLRHIPGNFLDSKTLNREAHVVYHELSEEVGVERAPDLQDKTKLNYFWATVMETQRLGSIVPQRSVDATVARGCEHWLDIPPIGRGSGGWSGPSKSGSALPILPMKRAAVE
ncbi:cytochrome p450 ii f2-like protein ii [Plakobranchus ocellatus]|uniref:Cytochrome p450 ii f2-like protein ii n=1 Tax=Plakobranchus ocellatus TaxID=259542 RepID=A0AAV4ARX2_9GAST|nr:cytochrome p450 ii f2-like protein ii [Plakobranchus ocellatus]